MVRGRVLRHSGPVAQQTSAIEARFGVLRPNLPSRAPKIALTPAPGVVRHHFGPELVLLLQNPPERGPGDMGPALKGPLLGLEYAW